MKVTVRADTLVIECPRLVEWVLSLGPVRVPPSRGDSLRFKRIK